MVAKNLAATPADFETAINVAGFGRFNIMLILVAVPATVSTILETTTISYILASAECDLNLSLLDKGILNAIVYAGMITSAIPWGYIADAKGRKKILVFGFLADAICGLGCASSQTTLQLIIFKFFGGLVMCGPFAVLMSYISEMYGKKYRARIMMLTGSMFSLGQLVLPFLAVMILPNKWEYHIFNLTIHSWNIFLAACTTPAVLGGLLLTLFPESPKFLMSQGRNKEAMEVFRHIYAINMRQPKDTYPIKELVNELAPPPSLELTVATVEEVNITVQTVEDGNNAVKAGQWRNGLRNLKPLFKKPYLKMSLLVYLMNFFLLYGQNTMRLWLPQLFASYQAYGNDSNATGDSSVCNILEYNVNKTALIKSNDDYDPNCEVIITVATYTNNLIVGLCSLFGYAVASAFVNKIGVKNMILTTLSIAGTCAIGLYWSTSSTSAVALTAIFVTCGSIASTSIISASVNLFPTSLRTMIVSLGMMMGRCGSLIGNILFPMFMTIGCIPPLIMFSFVMFAACITSTFLPSTKKAELK